MGYLNNLNKMLSAEISENEFPRQKKKFWKFWLVIFFMNLGLAIILIRLFTVQIVNADKYNNLAKKQQESRIELPSHRGMIFDRNGKVLATNINSISVAVDPAILEHGDEIANILSNGLSYPLSTLKQKIANKKRRFTWLVRGVIPDKIEAIFSIEDRGLIIVQEPKRYYPYGEAGAQVIGFTDIDNNGIGGIELQFDKNLSGQDGYVIMRKNALQKLSESPELPRLEPNDGNSVQLTLDIDLQRIVQYELEKGVEFSMAAGGTVICIQPNTGKVLAIASYPFFDPNRRETIKSVNTRLRGLTDEYAPGSTFKIITASALFQEDIVNENDSVYGYNGQMVFNWGTIKDVHPIGASNFKEATWQSSNIVYANLANELSDRTFYSYIRNFGFGNKLDIDLPGEIPGKLKRPEKFNNSSKRYMGHGYDMTATPLQVVSAYSTIANKGEFMQPYIVSKVFNEEEVIEEKKPSRIRRVIREETADRINKLFIGVVDSGSGKRTKIKDLKIVGKTGTSQKIGPNGKYSKSDYIASFSGYFPADDPEVAMIVIIDRPRKSIYGGFNAAPVFKKITQSWVNIRGLNSKIERSDLEKDSIILPDLTGIEMSRAKEIARSIGFNIESKYDSGIIYYQVPQASSKIERGGEINVNTISEDGNKLEPQKLDLKGMPLRNALNLLHTFDIKTEVIGNGKVRSQKWKKTKNEIKCTLICR